MSQGFVICSICKREAGQGGKRDENGRRPWFHREDGSNICEGGTVIYADEEPPMMLNYYPRPQQQGSDPVNE